MKHIGGFFGLELTYGDFQYHPNALALSTGRACINLLLKELKPSKVYVPYYTCNATYEPFAINGVATEYYEIDELLFPKQLPELKQNEYFFYTNYFGVKKNHVAKLLEIFGERLIIDDTHSFFGKGYASNWSFTSARKYFGVPDGAYLYSPLKISESFERFKQISVEHNVNRLIGNQALAYEQYVAYEKTLTSEINAISLYSEMVLSHIDYNEVMEKRKRNFRFYLKELGHINQLKDITETGDVPFCYPFLPPSAIERKLFFENQVYIPSYWMDTLERNIPGFEFEKKLSSNMLPLIIDHRYEPADLERIVTLINKHLYGK